MIKLQRTSSICRHVIDKKNKQTNITYASRKRGKGHGKHSQSENDFVIFTDVKALDMKRSSSYTWKYNILLTCNFSTFQSTAKPFLHSRLRFLLLLTCIHFFHTLIHTSIMPSPVLLSFRFTFTHLHFHRHHCTLT